MKPALWDYTRYYVVPGHALVTYWSCRSQKRISSQRFPPNVMEQQKIPVLQSTTVAELVGELRHLLDFDQKDVAEHFNLNHSLISRIESGQKSPARGFVAGMLQLVNVSFGDTPEFRHTLRTCANDVLGNYAKKRFKSWDIVAQEAEKYEAGRRDAKRKKDRARSGDFSDQLEITYSSRSPYPRLIGIEQAAERLKATLLDDNGGWIVSVDGAGGLGKTTLVDFVVHQPEVTQRFAAPIWVTAKPHEFVPGTGIVPTTDFVRGIDDVIDILVEHLQIKGYQTLSSRQKRDVLRRALSETPTLIVVDNLEKIGNALRLLPLLQELAQPSKFVITSRYQIPKYNGVKRIRLSQLSLAHSIELFRHLAELYDSDSLKSANVPDLEKIYAHTGGNPLAIKLVAAHITSLSLPAVLKTLANRPDAEIDAFYTFLYQDLWDSLPTSARKLFAAMPLTAGASVAQLEAIAGVEISELLPSVRQLARLNLINVEGGLQHRRYSLHRLAETFLLKRIGDWNRTAQDAVDSGQESEFAQAIQRNLFFWQTWYHQNQHDTKRIDAERESLVRAIEYGLVTSGSLPATHHLIESLSPYMERRGQWESWGRILSSAIDAALHLSDCQICANLMIARAKLFQRQGRLQDAILAYQRLIRYAKQGGDEYSTARAYSNLGYLYTEQGKWGRAEILCRSALKIFTKHESNHGLAHTHNHLGILYAREQCWNKAWYHYEQAQSLWQETNDQYGLLLVNLNSGTLANDMAATGVESPHNATVYLEKAIEYGEQVDDEPMLATARMNLGISHMIDRRYPKAVECFEAAKATFERFKDRLGIALVSDNLGIVYAEQLEHKEAQRYLKQALESWRIVPSRYGEIRTLLYLAEYSNGEGSSYKRQAAKLLDGHGQQRRFQSLITKVERLDHSEPQ